MNNEEMNKFNKSVLGVLFLYVILYVVDFLLNVTSMRIIDIFKTFGNIIIYIFIPLYYFLHKKKGKVLNYVFLISIVVPAIMSIIKLDLAVVPFLLMIIKVIFAIYLIFEICFPNNNLTNLKSVSIVVSFLVILRCGILILNNGYIMNIFLLIVRTCYYLLLISYFAKKN